MMLEKQSMEQAELYALGFLPSDEATVFEKQLKYDEDLQRYLEELNDSLAAVALTAPQLDPPAGTLQAIQEQIDHARKARPWYSRFVLAPIWAAAAIIVLSVVSIHQAVRNHHSQQEVSQLKQKLDQLEAMGGVADDRSQRKREQGTRSQLTHEAPNFGTGPVTQRGAIQSQYRLSQSLESLKQKVSKLQAANDDRFTANAGISRMVVVEMLDPNMDQDEKRERRMVLPVEVSDILASGLDVRAPEENNTVTLSGNDNSWEGQLVIESGMVNLDLINLPDGETIIHKNFPLDEIDRYRGIERLPDGQFYDAFGDILWRPGLNGEYVGSRPNETVVVEPAPQEPVAPESIPDSPARAFTLFDETTGQGSILVSNIPPPGEDTVYQLWMDTPGQDRPISLGVIPQLEEGSGRIGFELPESNFSPSNYRLTAEPVGGSFQPSGPTILSGP